MPAVMASLRQFWWLAWAMGFGFTCSLNHAGLGTDGGSDRVGADGLTGSPTGGQTGDGTGGSGLIIGSGGRGNGGTPGAGDAVVATGGTVGLATGGASGTGGSAGRGYALTGGAPGSGGNFESGGATDTGGATATGGIPGTGGATGTGGIVGSGGAIGLGTGGKTAASGGREGAAGRGTGGGIDPGTGGRSGCDRFPNAQSFVTPPDERNHCYWFHAERMTWPAARMLCQKEMGDLVTIRSAAENDFVLGVARFTGSPPEIWLGGTDDRPGSNTMGAGTYHWVTNEAWSYTRWNTTPPAQPDGYCDPCSNGQACTCDHRATLAMDGSWFDFWQDNPRAFVCEATP
jgi:hypothetical protein